MYLIKSREGYAPSNFCKMPERLFTLVNEKGNQSGAPDSILPC